MLIPPGYANLQFVFDLPNSRQALVGIGFGIAAFENTDMEAIEGAVLAAQFLGNVDDSVTISLLRLVVGTSDPSAPIVYERGVDIEGTNAGTSLPPGSAFLIKKSTLRGGRKGRGRAYWPGVPADYVDEGGVIQQNVGTIGDQFTAMIGDITEATVSLDPAVLLHTGSETPDEITGWSVDPMIATQRRRLRG